MELKITRKNVHLVLFRINQFLSRHEAFEYYTDWGWHHKYLNRLGIKDFHGGKFTERSNSGYTTRLKCRATLHTHDNCAIHIYFHGGGADVLYFGQKITILPTHIFYSGYDKTLRRQFSTYFKPFRNITRAIEFIAYEEHMDTEYWKSYEEELMERETKESLIKDGFLNRES